MEKIALELAKGRSAQEQQQIYESQRHYEAALRFNNAGDFEKAKIEAQKAVQAWHENTAARKLLNDVNRITVGGRPELGARSIAEDARDDFRVRIEQAQIEITKHVRDGERYLNARMYEQAVKEFENAEFKILNIPYEVKAMNDLLPLVKDSIVKARNARILEERRTEEEKKRMAEAEAAAHEIATKREVTRKIAHLLELAYMAFDQKKFDRCIKLCEEVLLIDPHYTVARELKEDSEKTRHKEEYYSILAIRSSSGRSSPTTTSRPSSPGPSRSASPAATSGPRSPSASPSRSSRRKAPRPPRRPTPTSSRSTASSTP
jgi:tetratricopeptide (TPR) repeat protein